MKTFMAILLFSLCSMTFAMCENSEVAFGTHLDDTLDLAYEADGSEVPFVKGEYVWVRIKALVKTFKLKEGTLTDDGAGNNGISASSSKVSLDLFHDHEVWHEGLDGSIEAFGKTYDLKNIQDCSWDDLF